MAVDLGGTLASVTAGAKEVGFIGVGILAWFALLIVFSLIAGGIAYLLVHKKKYKNQIVVFKKIGGQFKPAIRDRAMEMKHGTDGTTIFYLKRLKKIIPTPSMQVDTNMYYFFERADGEWINFLPGDFDEQSKRMGAHFLDKEMRHVRLALESNLSNRLEKKPTWLAEHWTMIAGIGFIAIIGVMTFLLFDKWIELAAVTNAGVENAGDVMSKVSDILGAMDNICTGGSGIVQATP